MIIDVSGQIAQIIDDRRDESVTVNFLEKRSASTFFFSPDEHVVSRGDITSFLAERLEDTGRFIKENNYFVAYHESDDEDYIHSDESESEDESLVDEEIDLED